MRAMLAAGSTIGARIGPCLAKTRGTWARHTGKPKKGEDSVGLQLGKQDDCQIAVSLSVANDDVSLPIAHQLYLDGRHHRARAGVPDDVTFQTKRQFALDPLREAFSAKVEAEVVLAQRRLWHGLRLPGLHHGSRRSLRRRLTVLHKPVVARQESAGTKELERIGKLDFRQPLRRPAPTGVSQTNGTGAPRIGLPPTLSGTMRLGYVR